MRNLKAEMIRKGITKEVMANHLGIKAESLRRKVSGEIQFSLKQAFDIQEEFFPDHSIEYLFKEK